MNKFGEFLNKVGAVVKDNGADVAGIAIKAATGNVSGAIADVFGVLGGEGSEEAKKLLNELETRRMEFEAEMYALEVKDRDSARNREVELAKAGGSDWMMYVSGLVALGTFVLMVIAIIFFGDNVKENPMFHQLMGIIEGVALTVFSFYFGTSKGSKDKTKLLKGK